MCTESELLEVKVPIVFLGTVGFSPRRDGRYVCCIFRTHARTLALKGFPRCPVEQGSWTGLADRQRLCASNYIYHPFHRWPFADVLAIHSPLRCIVHRKIGVGPLLQLFWLGLRAISSSHDVHIPLGQHK
jgi:hypothetical protein